MSNEDNLEDYLEYFIRVYEQWTITEQQKVIYLIERLPKIQAKYV